MAEARKNGAAGRAAGGAKGGAKAKAGDAGWTPTKEDIFFRELAVVCNVTGALRACGMLRQRDSFYDRRKRDPEFAAAWDAALAESYALLELEMLQRARLGDDRPPPANASEARQREIPTRLGLQLLRLHQSKVKGKAPSAQRPMRGQKLRDELEKRLSEISRRLGGVG
jgi:hypothetical protein